MGGWIGLFLKRPVSAHRVKADTLGRCFSVKEEMLEVGMELVAEESMARNQGPGSARQGREQAEPRMAKPGKKLGGRVQIGTWQSRLFRAEAGEKASGSCQSRLCAGSTIKTELCV